jgi:hypothetical protein
MPCESISQEKKIKSQAQLFFLRELIEAKFGVQYSRVHAWRIATHPGRGKTNAAGAAFEANAGVPSVSVPPPLAARRARRRSARSTPYRPSDCRGPRSNSRTDVSRQSWGANRWLGCSHQSPTRVIPSHVSDRCDNGSNRPQEFAAALKYGAATSTGGMGQTRRAFARNHTFHTPLKMHIACKCYLLANYAAD